MINHMKLIIINTFESIMLLNTIGIHYSKAIMKTLSMIKSKYEGNKLLIELTRLRRVCYAQAH